MRPRPTTGSTKARRAACFPAAEALALFCLALPAAAACPSAGAVYAPAVTQALPDAATITLLPPAPEERMANSGLDLRLSMADRAPMDFGTAETLGFGSTLAFPRDGNPIHDPEARPEFPFAAFALGAEGQLVPAGLVLDGNEAPHAIQIAGIGAALWYGTNGSDRPVILPEALWYRIRCGA